jgi:predicted glycoside hydrolase/deacetylase ChbG (UPF0249 family)
MQEAIESMNRKMSLLSVGVALIAISTAGAFGGRAMAQRPYRLSDRELERIIRTVEKQADTFRKSLDDALDKSRFDGKRREDEVNASVREFDRETKRLHDHFDGHQSTSADVQSILDRAISIERFMRRNRLTPRAQTDWAALRVSLDQLAAAYTVFWRWDGSGPVPVVEAPYRISDREVERIIRNIESQSDRVRSSLDRALDRSRLNDTRREDDINAYVKDFYSETKQLHDHFDSHKSTSADVQSVLNHAARIDQFMRRYPLTREAQNDWSALKVNLDLLARTYSVNWGWQDYVPPVRVPVEVLPAFAIINVNYSTNRRDRGYRITLARDGRAEVSVGNSLTTRYIDRGLAERFFSDLSSARPLAQLSVDAGCGRSTTFGRSTYVSFGNERTPDLTCPVGPRAQALRDDLAAITAAVNLR